MERRDGRRFGIRELCLWNALAAVDLALVAGTPMLVQVPILLYTVVLLNLVVSRAMIARRPLTGFHYAYLLVGFVAALSLTWLLYRPSLRGRPGSLGIVRGVWAAYREGRGLPAESPATREAIDFAESVVTSALSVGIGLVAGWTATRIGRTAWARRSPWPGRATAFVQGSLLGFATSILLMIAIRVGLGFAESPVPAWMSHLFTGLVWVLPILGGLIAVGLRPNAAGLDASPERADDDRTSGTVEAG